MHLRSIPEAIKQLWVPVVWAVADVDPTAIKPAIAITRKPTIIETPLALLLPRRLQGFRRRRFDEAVVALRLVLQPEQVPRLPQ
jgi:hypothetical protein